MNWRRLTSFTWGDINFYVGLAVGAFWAWEGSPFLAAALAAGLLTARIIGSGVWTIVDQRRDNRDFVRRSANRECLRRLRRP